MDKMEKHPETGGYKPPSAQKPISPKQKEKPLVLRGPGYHVWNADELAKMPMINEGENAPIPPGSAATWPGGGSAGIVDRLPAGSKKALGIKGSNRLT